MAPALHYGECDSGHFAMYNPGTSFEDGPDASVCANCGALSPVKRFSRIDEGGSR